MTTISLPAKPIISEADTLRQKMSEVFSSHFHTAANVARTAVANGIERVLPDTLGVILADTVREKPTTSGVIAACNGY